MTSFNVVESAKAPQPIGCYSQAVRVGNLVFLSGQIGLDPKTSELVSGGCEAQLRQIFTNMQEVIHAAGGDFTHIIKLTIYLCDLNDFALVNELMKIYFQPPYPARSTIQVAALPKNADLEIEAIVSLF